MDDTARAEARGWGGKKGGIGLERKQRDGEEENTEELGDRKSCALKKRKNSLTQSKLDAKGRNMARIC